MAELMKGKVWHERKHKMTYPCRAEVKYDEIRCHVRVFNGAVAYHSYAGKPLANMHAFDSLWLAVSKYTAYTEFDCGFECNGNFNDSYRWVRSTKGIPKDLGFGVTTHKFILFDLPELTDYKYAQRLPEIEWVANTAHSAELCAAEGWKCSDEGEVDECYRKARLAKQEGLMVKSLDHTYERGKRIDGWLKMKPENDADGKIVGFVEAICGKDQPERGLREGDPLNRVGSVLVQCEDGSTAAPHGIAHDLGRDMWDHPTKYTGKWCEFSYMMMDRNGGYRHPVFRRLREDKA